MDMENHPIVILVEELKTTDIKRKKEAIKNLSTIAIVLGPEKTRNELLKNIIGLIEEQEVLMEFLNEQLFYDLLHFIGGTNHINIVALIEPLESLSTREDAIIRDRALAVLQALLLHAGLHGIEDDAMAVTLNLMHGEWFTSKMSGV